MNSCKQAAKNIDSGEQAREAKNAAKEARKEAKRAWKRAGGADLALNGDLLGLKADLLHAEPGSADAVNGVRSPFSRNEPKQAALELKPLHSHMIHPAYCTPPPTRLVPVEFAL